MIDPSVEDDEHAIAVEMVASKLLGMNQSALFEPGDGVGLVTLSGHNYYNFTSPDNPRSIGIVIDSVRTPSGNHLFKIRTTSGVTRFFRFFNWERARD